MCDDERTGLNPKNKMGKREAIERLIDMMELDRPKLNEAIDIAIKAIRDYNDCVNELCIKCGKYTESYKGACEDCRWEH